MGSGREWAKPDKAELNSTVVRDLTLPVQNPLVLWLGHQDPQLSTIPFSWQLLPIPQILGAFLE